MELKISKRIDDIGSGFLLFAPELQEPALSITELFKPLQSLPHIEDKAGVNRLALKIFSDINSSLDFLFYSDVLKIFECEVAMRHFSSPDVRFPNMYLKGGPLHKVYRTQRIVDFCLERKELVSICKSISPLLLDRLLEAGVFPYRVRSM
ncbi:MAG: hypothetical protein J7501_16010 [Bdellovibrio sp.]|nr:hypothetical protein [Bdellovibrio sp.]